MTDNTANLPVGTLNELGIPQEDLFPYLQRRYLSPSALACGYFRLLPLFRRGYCLKYFFVTMAADAGTDYLFRGYSRFLLSTAGDTSCNQSKYYKNR
jgi:hypothetical protein